MNLSEFALKQEVDLSNQIKLLESLKKYLMRCLNKSKEINANFSEINMMLNNLN
jgi:hypothetical protein